MKTPPYPPKRAHTALAEHTAPLYAPAALCAVLAASSALAAQPQAAEPDCIAPHSFIALEADMVGTVADATGRPIVALGMYERISPDGRFVLRSFSGAQLGQVSLIELPAQGTRAVRAYRTPLSNEAFPVQGSWRYLVNPNGAHYLFADVLRQQQAARPRFRGGMTGFYTAASELGDPAAAPHIVRIRSFSWPNSAGGERMGQGALSTRTLSVDTQRHAIIADTGVRYLCAHRASVDGSMYALPMISVDGTEFVTLPQRPIEGRATMRIFGLGADGTGCEPLDAFVHQSGKSVFGFPPQGQSGQAHLAYEYRAQIWWYHRALRQPFLIAPPLPEGALLLAGAFPGITRDGRIIYAATLRQCDAKAQNCTQQVGYAVSDPWQSQAWRNWAGQHPQDAASAPRCITHSDIAHERQRFAQQHGLEE